MRLVPSGVILWTAMICRAQTTISHGLAVSPAHGVDRGHSAGSKYVTLAILWLYFHLLSERFKLDHLWGYFHLYN